VIVQKFGGTSVEDAAAIERLARIVADARAETAVVVVVSAMGRTTDRLVWALGLACRGDGGGALAALEEIGAGTRAAVRQLFGAEDVLSARLDPLFAELDRMAGAIAVLGSAPEDVRDRFLAQGEIVSSWIVAEALVRQGLPAVRVDAREALVTDARFGRAAPDFAKTAAAAAARLGAPAARGEVPVVGGFVGATEDGRTTVLGRGGSDYSAAIFGAVLDASRVEIWTDVDGMMTADPRIVPEARVLEQLSPEEASELAYFGARVLHPLTLAPAIEKGIPVRVRNSRRPEGRGTEIRSGATRGGDDVRSIACKRSIVTVDVSTSRMLMAAGFLRTLFEVFDRHEMSVDMVSTSEVSVSVTVDDVSSLPEIRRNLSFVVADEDAERAVRLLHTEFFGSGDRTSRS